MAAGRVPYAPSTGAVRASASFGVMVAVAIAFTPLALTPAAKHNSRTFYFLKVPPLVDPAKREIRPAALTPHPAREALLTQEGRSESHFLLTAVEAPESVTDADAP